MTKHPKREPEPFDYWSTSHSLDEEIKPLSLFCPRCKKTVQQVKSYWRVDGKITNEIAVRCQDCGLVYNSAHYNNLLKELKNTGFKIPT